MMWHYPLSPLPTRWLSVQIALSVRHAVRVYKSVLGGKDAGRDVETVTVCAAW